MDEATTRGAEELPEQMQVRRDKREQLLAAGLDPYPTDFRRTARFAEILEPVMHVERCEMLCEATRRAIAAARPGEVVLFSPACASFDQFRDYEQRGDSFRKLVAELTGSPEGAPGAFPAKSAA